MVAPMASPMKQNEELKLPILSDKIVPKKEPVSHKVLEIKLPLDIDITIQRDYNCSVALLLIALVLLFSLPFLFLYSYHSQMQLYKHEIADLRIMVSAVSFTSASLSTTSHLIENTISEVRSMVEQCDCKRTKVKGIRQKRDTEAGQNGAMKAENELNESVRDSTSNETMRGNVKIQGRLLKNNRKGNGFGAVRAAHFKGLLPEKVVEAGQIGPWYEDKQAVGDFALRSCNLRDRGVKLIVNETGLYLIYAQVYYLTSKSLNSYSINVNPGNKSHSIPVAFCSANASLNDQGASEVSCYTSIVRRLQAGDAISLQQQERERRLVMREGHSFVGLVRLS